MRVLLHRCVFIPITGIVRYLALLLSFIIILASTQTAAEEPLSLKIATANKEGVYYPVGIAIANVLSKEGIKLKVLPSNGSHENLNWISTGVIDLCLAQSDTVYNAYEGVEYFEDRVTNIKAIASLYSEVVYVLVRNPLHITKLDDLRGKRISIGPVGSGSALTARAILETAGISMNEIREKNMSLKSAERALSNNLIDVVFQTSGIPSAFVKGVTDREDAYVLRIDPEIAQRLIRKYPYFVSADIPANNYKGHREDISTLGVRALLIGRSDLDDELAYRITKSIYKNRNTMIMEHDALRDLRLSAALDGIEIPVFDGTKRYLKESGYYRMIVFKKILFALLMLGLIVLSAYLMIQLMEARNIVRIIYFFTTRNIARVLVSLFVVWMTGSLVLFVFEHKINLDYTTMELSLWSGLINMVSFGQKEPLTVVGRMVASTMMLFGLAGIAWFTGMIVSVFVQKKLPGVIIVDKMQDHYVILNWNLKGPGIIKQLHSSVLSKKRPVVIVNETEIEMEEIQKYEGLYFVQGNPENSGTLEKAGVHNARSAIILAQSPEAVSNATNSSSIPLALSKQLSDSKSIMAILAINEIVSRHRREGKLTVIAEILDPQKVHLAMNTGDKHNITVKVVSSAMLAQDLLAQAAVVPELTEIYDELLTYDDNRCAIYKREVPANFYGKTRNDLFFWLMGLRDKEIHITPIGLMRGRNIYLNSKEDEIELLRKGDFFLAICFSEADLQEAEKQL